MSDYYLRHVFFCANQRDGKRCCADFDADGWRDYAKKRVQAAGFHGRGQVRVNRSGCLDRCAAGPVLVIYPEAVWYKYAGRDDIDEIIEQHLLGGAVVDRLRI